MPTVLYPEALRLGLALLAVGLAGLAFAWRRQGLPPRRLAALLGVRAVSLLVLLVLVCRPVWVEGEGDGATPRIAVLLDRSESMSLVERARAATPARGASLATSSSKPCGAAAGRRTCTSSPRRRSPSASPRSGRARSTAGAPISGAP